MKVKQLRKFLEKFDGDLEVMGFEVELGEFYPIEKKYIKVEKIYVSEYGEFYPFDVGMRLFNKMGQIADKNTDDNTREVLVI